MPEGDCIYVYQAKHECLCYTVGHSFVNFTDFVDFWDFHEICFTKNSISCKFMCIVKGAPNVIL